MSNIRWIRTCRDRKYEIQFVFCARMCGIVFLLFLTVYQSSADSAQNERIYDRAVRSTVMVINVEAGLTASGVLIDKTLRLLVTNQHVINGVDRVDVVSPCLTLPLSTQHRRMGDTPDRNRRQHRSFCDAVFRVPACERIRRLT